MLEVQPQKFQGRACIERALFVLGNGRIGLEFGHRIVGEGVESLIFFFLGQRLQERDGTLRDGRVGEANHDFAGARCRRAVLVVLGIILGDIELALREMLSRFCQLFSCPIRVRGIREAQGEVAVSFMRILGRREVAIDSIHLQAIGLSDSIFDQSLIRAGWMHMLEMSVSCDGFGIESVLEIGISDPPFDFLRTRIQWVVVEEEAIFSNRRLVAFAVVRHGSARVDLVGRRDTHPFAVAGSGHGQKNQDSDDAPS